ncbi:MAG: Ig-like domain-containing protein [Candidatus Eisenbacteria bacterium]|nr:Ig-like domain-containing protein [Candidatus Eisenbacteria bacterium]
MSGIGCRRCAAFTPGLLALLVCVLACSCARRGLPPGGPVDAEPPRVVSTAPDSGAAGVGAASWVCITFSEQMDKRSVRDAVTMRPAVKVGETSWKENSFCLAPAESLAPATTYGVTLMSGCKDSHGNATREPYAFTFSTGDSVAAGRIAGVVTAKSLPAPGMPVWAFDSARTPMPDFVRDAGHYVSQAGSKGEFELLGLPAGTYLLFAFKDKDGNRVYDEGTDFASPAQSPARVTADEPAVSDVEIALVDPKEPGGVRGVVHHCFVPESVAVAVVAVSLADSAVSFSGGAGRDSVFSMGDMPAGRYKLTCFADLNRNGVRDAQAEAECLEPHFVEVTPGEVVTGVELRLACPTPRPQRTEEAPADAETRSPMWERPDAEAQAPDTTRAPVGADSAVTH